MICFRGFKYRNIDSSTYNLYVKTDNIHLLPERYDESINVLGRNDTYIYTGKYKERIISLQCELDSNLSYAMRRQTARQIASWLSLPGELILNYELDKKYSARVSKEINLEMLLVYDKFTIDFICQPIAEQTFHNNGLDLSLEVPLEFVNIPIDGYATSFVATGATTLTLRNLGTYEVLPLISITGTASSITIADDDANSFTYASLSNATVYIDCKNKLVYSISGNSKVNKRQYFSGDYIKLLSGTNTIDVSGTITSVTIAFDYLNAFL